MVSRKKTEKPSDGARRAHASTLANELANHWLFRNLAAKLRSNGQGMVIPAETSPDLRFTV
jgi:hypothetical protein